MRSLLFYIGLGMITPLFALPLLAAWFLPFAVRDYIARGWCRTVLVWLWLTCGVRHRIEGRERLPRGPAVILSKHQSAWETIALRTLLSDPMSWVMKRALFRIPFYGWSLRALEEIGIDRGSARKALRQVVEKGRAHLASGRWVVIFPEGTRMPPGQMGHYAQGGAHLAIVAGVPVVPVALNSGRCWPRSDWRKYPGTITVRIGPALSTEGQSPTVVIQRVQAWIEAQMADL